MKVFREIAEVRAYTSALRQRECRLGCVPTMGALHPGHLSLVDECRKHVDEVLVTIFVNPTQFSPHEDLNKYPRPVERDLQACEAAGVAAVYMPEVAALYPAGYDTWVNVDQMSTILEGECRPGHFRGVTTIVLKLFNIVQPDVACFGAKDYQQQTLIRQMVRDLNLPVEIIICPTMRESDGLAMSSRNVFLSESERKSALSLSQCLQLAEIELCKASQSIAEIEAKMLAHLNSFPNVKPEYAVIRDADMLQKLDKPQADMVVLIAAKVGQTRLIDNRRILR